MKYCSLKEIFRSVFLPQLIKIVEHNKYSTFLSTFHSILFLFYFLFFTFLFLVGWGWGGMGVAEVSNLKLPWAGQHWATVNVLLGHTNGRKTKEKRTHNHLLRSKLFKRFRRTS